MVVFIGAHLLACQHMGQRHRSNVSPGSTVIAFMILTCPQHVLFNHLIKGPIKDRNCNLGYVLLHIIPLLLMIAMTCSLSLPLHTLCISCMDHVCMRPYCRAECSRVSRAWKCPYASVCTPGRQPYMAGRSYSDMFFSDILLPCHHVLYV